MPITQQRLYSILLAARHIEQVYTASLTAVAYTTQQVRSGAITKDQFFDDIGQLTASTEISIALDLALLQIEEHHYRTTHRANDRTKQRKRLQRSGQALPVNQGPRSCHATAPDEIYLDLSDRVGQGLDPGLHPTNPAPVDHSDDGDNLDGTLDIGGFASEVTDNIINDFLDEGSEYAREQKALRNRFVRTEAEIAAGIEWAKTHPPDPADIIEQTVVDPYAGQVREARVAEEDLLD